MAGRRYAHVPSARRPRAAFDVESRPAGAFCSRLLAQSLRHGLPASKRLGRVRAALARSGLADRAPVAGLRLLNPRPRPDIDRIVEEIADAWPVLGLAEPLPRLRALVLHRKTALTVFVFSESDEPLVVVKMPGDAERLERDAGALRAAAGADVAPRFLGRVGEAYVQEALRGFALPIEPLTPSRAASLDWQPAHADLAAALARLAAATAVEARPEQLADSFDGLAAAGPLRAAARRTVAAAGRDLRDLRRATLTHGDTSPHNCLTRGGRLTGLVDWEGARFHGAPGFDLWNHAVSYLEHGVGLVSWSPDALHATFEPAWSHSSFFREARAAARACALAAEVPERLLDQLEIAFFARRLQLRLADPPRFPTGSVLAARMLEVVCEH